jgi:hypothetical protein
MVGAERETEATGKGSGPGWRLTSSSSAAGAAWPHSARSGQAALGDAAPNGVRPARQLAGVGERLFGGARAARRACAGLMLGAALVLADEGALAQSSLLPEGWLEAQANEAGQRCERKAEQRQNSGLLVACGAAGVWEVALDEAGPRFVRSFAFDGDVIGFLNDGEHRIWVQVQAVAAAPLSSGRPQVNARFPEELPFTAPAPPRPAALPEPAPAAATPAPTPSPAAKTIGRVVRAAPGEVWVSLGSLDEVSRNDRIELFHPAAAVGGFRDEHAEEQLAVGVVVGVGPSSAKVRLGVNEVVPEGAQARLTRAPTTASLAAPPRPQRLWSLDVMARPFAAMGELGGGVLLSASMGRRFAGNWHVRAVLDPAAIADVQDQQSVSAANFALLGSYDSQYFEMGLGFGAQTVNQTALFLDPGSGLSVAQLIRFGASDGLNITARTSIVLFHSQFYFGGMVATGQIPVARGFWLLLGGGGGDVGYGYGELGLRVLLGGNGAAGSRYLTVTAGGAGVFAQDACDPFGSCGERSYGGPMAGVGGEWRF